MRGPRERAARLVRWYPRAWRARYGEEFTELLIAELAERPRSPSRTADVIRGGLVARLADAGLCGGAPQAPELARAQARAGLASLARCAAVFLGVGGAIWSQLVIGWQWSAPDTAGTAVATFVMTGTVLVLALLALLAALPVAYTVAARLLRGRASGLAVPSALFLAGLAITIVGGRHFGNGWPGTGGHPWARTGLVPGGVAAFSRASTLSVSSFWAHPAALAAFPAAELTWMALSPLALAWNPHPGDDPMAMVIGELIPRCRRLGLGRPPRRIAAMGISMGGYGALLLAERYPRLFAAVAAVSPAVWTSYPQARQANPGAFASAAAFAAGDVIAHAPALGRRPVRVASGSGDPFYPGVQALARALPASAVVAFGPGCHDGSFFTAQEPPSLAFLATHLA